MTPTPDATLRQIVAQVRPDESLASVERVERGNSKRTDVLRFADADPLVVQRTADPTVARTEARLLAAVDERTSVPVVRPLASGVCEGTGWFVAPLVDGRDLHEAFVDLGPTAQERVAAAFGRYLAELHDAFRFDGYGGVVADGDRLVAGGVEHCPSSGSDDGDSGEVDGSDGDSGEVDGSDGDGADSDPARDPRPGTAAGWRDWFGAFAEASIDRLPAAFDALRPALLEAVADAPGTAPTARLFPWDFRPGNALVDGERVTAVVDWERPLAADRALGVAKTEYLVADWYVPVERARTLRESFREGYASVRPLPTVTPAHRVAAVANTAVDSRGVVTNPRYPPVDRDAAVSFHRRALDRVL